MKKSQSIFLLSGLVPLVAAPVAIVASCSSDSTATTFSLKTNVTLTGLADNEKDPNQYAGADNKKKLADLIFAKKDQIFNNPPADLKVDQIQITNDVTANTNDGSLTFKLKVISTATPTTDLIAETDVVLKGFTANQTGQQQYTITLTKNTFNATDIAEIGTKPITDFDNETKVKTFVLANKSTFFTFDSNQIGNFDWENNLTITNVNADTTTDPNAHKLTFTLKLAKATNTGTNIENQQITVTGFQQTPQTSAYTITLTKNTFNATDIAEIGTKPITDFDNETKVKTFVLANKSTFFTFDSNQIGNFDWENNLTITNVNADTTTDPNAHKLTFTLKLAKATNTGTNIENQQITVTGFQQ